MGVGERIKARRKEIGLSAEQVAKELGVSPATVYRYESNDIMNMRIDKLEPIAKALHTTPAYLMGWEEDKYSIPSNAIPIDFKNLKRIPGWCKTVRNRCRFRSRCRKSVGHTSGPRLQKINTCGGETGPHCILPTSWRFWTRRSCGWKFIRRINVSPRSLSV